MKEPTEIETFFFADETKFSVKNQEPENAIYYLLLKVDRIDVKPINGQYEKIITDFELTKGFHATKDFKEKKPNKELMEALCSLIVDNRIDCFCFKYHKDKLHEPAKRAFSNLNVNPIFNFDSQEFQAIFFLVQTFDNYLQGHDNLIKPKGLIFFDKNVYGQKEIEAFDFESNELLKRMIFASRNKIKLLGLPDFFGYLFRKSKLSQNKVQFGDLSIESSTLVINSYTSLLRISNAGLFHFLDIDDWLNKHERPT